MVMHARKIPRLNDGYYNRGSTHPFEEKGSSKSRDCQYSDKYRKVTSRSPEKHSPRYVNKSSYKDRTEKGRSHSPDGDRRSNHRDVSHRDPSVRHSTNNSSRSGSSGKDKKQDPYHRIEIQKSALRICQDWSEHLSSSGKRYYYNCKTEVSKWEKPKDWIDEKAVKTEYGRRKEAQLQKEDGLDRTKGSSGSVSSSRYNHNERSSSDRDKAYKDRGGGSDSRDYRDKNYSSSSSAQKRKESGSNSGGGSALTALQNPRAQLYNNTSSSSKERLSASGNTKNSAYRDKYGRPDSRNDRVSSGTPRSHQGSATPGAVDKERDHSESNHINKDKQSSAGDRRQESLVNDDTTNRQHEDMDISPGSTPTDESVARGLSAIVPGGPPMSSSQPQQVPPVATWLAAPSSVLGAMAALPELIVQFNDKALRGIGNTQSNPQGTAKLNSALQTLQKLHEALIAQQRQQQQQLVGLLKKQLQQQQLASSSMPPAPASSTTTSSQARSNGGMVAPRGLVSLGSIPSSVVATSVANHLGNSTPHGLPHGQPPQQLPVTSSPYVPRHHTPAHTDTHSPIPTVLSGVSQAQTCIPSDVPNSFSQPLYVVTENGGQSPGGQSAGTPLCSPELNLPDNCLHQTDTEKDTTQEDIRLSSPAGSQSSSQKAYAGLSAAALTQQETYKLPSSLVNFYNEELITHVASWPMEVFERQADQIRNDAHTVGNLYITQVSCELKKARSLVRVSEIQSTLQEQRVLFLRQQVKVLETFRNTNASFMSPKQGR